MPSNSKTGTFEALPPPKRQQKFPTLRRSVRHKKAHADVVPTLLKKQSSLTQVDFVSTPNARGDDRDIPSDGDFEEPRPKKRRKKSKFSEREEGQDSLTQVFGRLNSSRKIEFDEDGFQIWKDDDLSAEDMLEIPESSQLGVISSPQRADSAVDFKVTRHESKLRTPAKRRLKEIPSSQTPPSTKFSTHSHERKPAVQRSPLKERSTNVPTARKYSRSPVKVVNSKVLDDSPTEVHKVPLNDVDLRSSRRKRARGLNGNSRFSSPSPRKPPRKLQRVTTVQDSQSEDLDLSNTLVAESPVRPTPKLTTTTTVQDSQYEAAIVLSDSMQGDAVMSDKLVEDTQGYGGYTQATYDPVSAALDRDAARFGWTQTQAGPPKGISQPHEDSETDDEDLDRGCHQSPIAQAEQVLERSPNNTHTSFAAHDVLEDVVAEASPREHEHRHDAHVDADEGDDVGETTLVPHELIVSDEAVPSSPPVLNAVVDASAYETLAQTVPSSPPAVRPSQTSTDVPTQASLQLVLPDEDDDGDVDALPDTMLSEAPTVAPLSSSPQHSSDGLQNLYTCSSLPLPPWSSPRQASYTASAAPQASKVQDWSLPPPPPMSSSRTQTPASSSR